MGKRSGHIVITGAGGFLGGHVTALLGQRGFEVTALDDLSTGTPDATRASHLFVRLDLRDRSALHALLSNKHADAVVHLAGCRRPRRARRAPEQAAELNLGGTASLLGAMRSANVRRLVVGSSLAVYGDPGPAPVTESARIAPIGAYGRIARAEESLIRDCAGAWGLEAAVLRLAELGGARVGANPEGRADHGVVERLVSAAHRCHHRRPYILEGARASEGTFSPRVVDLLHVGDAARGVADLLGVLVDGGEPGTVNVSSGAGTSVAALSDAMGRVSGRDFPVVEGPAADGEPLALVASNRRLRRLTGWRPERSEVETVLRDAWCAR